MSSKVCVSMHDVSHRSSVWMHQEAMPRTAQLASDWHAPMIDLLPIKGSRSLEAKDSDPLMDLMARCEL